MGLNLEMVLSLGRGESYSPLAPKPAHLAHFKVSPTGSPQFPAGGATVGGGAGGEGAPAAGRIPGLAGGGRPTGGPVTDKVEIHHRCNFP